MTQNSSSYWNHLGCTLKCRFLSLTLVRNDSTSGNWREGYVFLTSSPKVRNPCPKIRISAHFQPCHGIYVRPVHSPGRLSPGETPVRAVPAAESSARRRRPCGGSPSAHSREPGASSLPRSTRTDNTPCLRGGGAVTQQIAAQGGEGSEGALAAYGAPSRRPSHWVAAGRSRRAAQPVTQPAARSL